MGVVSIYTSSSSVLWQRGVCCFYLGIGGWCPHCRIPSMGGQPGLHPSPLPMYSGENLPTLLPSFSMLSVSKGHKKINNTKNYLWHKGYITIFSRFEPTWSSDKRVKIYSISLRYSNYKKLCGVHDTAELDSTVSCTPGRQEDKISPTKSAESELKNGRSLDTLTAMEQVKW